MSELSPVEHALNMVEGEFRLLRTYITSLERDNSDLQQALEVAAVNVNERDKLVIENAELRKQLDEARRGYNELIFAVVRKFPNESRHQTALRYIIERESGEMNAMQTSKEKGEG